MLRVYACIIEEHDLRLVLVAGLICLLAAFTTFSILQQARTNDKRRGAWLAAAGFVSGIGIWSTHFVAMLAFEPQLPIGYDLGLTLLSIMAAVLVTALGWRIALAGRRWSTALAGTIVGAGIGTMHYIGMAAVTVAGRFVYDPALVAASIILGIGLTTLAIGDHRRASAKMPWRPALLFTVAICALHFTAMAAAIIYPDPNIAVPPAAFGTQTLMVGVVGMATIILTISIGVVLFDRKLDRRSIEEEKRLRAFADAAIEGLLVVDGDTIVDANHSLLSFWGQDQGSAARPELLSELLPALRMDTLPLGREPVASETHMVRADGRPSDVEAVVRPFNWQGRMLRVVAVRDISERKAAAAKIAHLAYHDGLTGLPNRTVFGEHLARTMEMAAEDGLSIAVLCLDLDGFKAVNDIHGHPAGDALLVEVAQRLRSATRGNELVARLGGDEFAIVQVGGAQPQHAGLLSERLIKAISEEIEVGGQPIRVSCSIGVAVFPSDAGNASDLVKNADMALYRAKAEGRGIARFYEMAMDEALRQRRQLETDLRQSIDRQELVVHYQPLADLESGSILGFEALLRWNHPTLGAVGPDIFIPLAEEGGFIVKLGAWVLRQACAEGARWQPALRLAVNLSPVQFVHGDLAGEVATILAETGFSPHRLELEVTEGLLIKDADRALTTLRRLKAMGVQISMDDFGTGYSSLSYFRMFPFDKVKIDQSFIREMIENEQARAIVRSVIGLGNGLGMPVVAEGVETSAQLAMLQEEGCTQVQGYLISRPGPIENFERIVIDRDGPTSLIHRNAA